MSDDLKETRYTHWVGGSPPTSLHANGPASFEHKTVDPTAVTCKLCRTLLERDWSTYD